MPKVKVNGVEIEVPVGGRPSRGRAARPVLKSAVAEALYRLAQSQETAE